MHNNMFEGDGSNRPFQQALILLANWARVSPCPSFYHERCCSAASVWLVRCDVATVRCVHAMLLLTLLQTGTNEGGHPADESQAGVGVCA
jgi:hypothetical protein